MRRQLSPPSRLLVPPGPQAFPQRHFLGESTVIVNHYSGIEKAIPSLPGFKTSAGMFLFSLVWAGGRVIIHNETTIYYESSYVKGITC